MNGASHSTGSSGTGFGFLAALFLAVCGFFCGTATAQAQVVTFTQSSDPVGIVNQTSFPTVGTQATTATAPSTSSGYSFTHWTVNSVRLNDDTGRSQNPATFVITGTTTATAHYVPTAQDSDSDGIPDWYELEYYGDLSQGPTSDTDADGFNLTTEYIRGYHPLVQDTVVQGGISRRRPATTTVILDNNYVLLTQTSSPAGFVNVQSVVLNGSTVALSTVPESSTGYQFTGWLVNGVRIDTALQNQPASVTVNGATTAVARYISSTADTDADGIPDWYELFYYDSLTNNAASDTDGDGFNFTSEILRGYSPVVADTVVQGGVSRRRSATASVNVTGFATYWLTSVPTGFVNTTVTVTTGTVVSTAELWGQAGSGYNFAYWDQDGTRQQDTFGIALGQVTFTVTANTTLTAHYFPTTQDSDGDGVPDWMEYVYYGGFGQSAASDTDGDGYTLATEVLRGYSPVLQDTVPGGGISRRRNGTNTIIFLNQLAIATSMATDVTANSATLNGAVNPSGLSTAMSFDYGTTVSYGTNVAATPTPVTGYSSTAVSAALSGLNAHTAYHYRVAGVNTGGTGYGSDATFTTANTSPTATADVANVTTGETTIVTLPYSQTDADGDAVSVQSISASAGAPFTLGAVSGNTVPVIGLANAAGTGTISFTVSDGFGGTADGSVTVTVIDNDAPFFTSAPPNITVGRASATAAAVVSFSAPTATDNIGVVSRTSSVPSGSSFPVGVTTVTWTARDAANNSANTSFTVTVTPTTAVQNWRQQYFGSTDNTGNAADDADWDGDGISNIMEFSFGTDPTSPASGPGSLQYTGTFAGGGTLVSGGQPVHQFEPIPSGLDLRAIFARRVDYVSAGLIYTVQFSADLVSWSTSTDTPTVLADNGTIQIVSVPYPFFVNGRKAKFFRVQITGQP